MACKERHGSEAAEYYIVQIECLFDCIRTSAVQVTVSGLGCSQGSREAVGASSKGVLQHDCGKADEIQEHRQPVSGQKRRVMRQPKNPDARKHWIRPWAPHDRLIADKSAMAASRCPSII